MAAKYEKRPSPQGQSQYGHRGERSERRKDHERNGEKKSPPHDRSPPQSFGSIFQFDPPARAVELLRQDYPSMYESK